MSKRAHSDAESLVDKLVDAHTGEQPEQEHVLVECAKAEEALEVIVVEEGDEREPAARSGRGGRGGRGLRTGAWRRPCHAQQGPRSPWHRR